MVIRKINEFDFDSFATNHKYYSYYQSSAYANLMAAHGLGYVMLGFYENETMVGAGLIINKKAFMGFKYGYAPRGLLIDYENYAQVAKITDKLKNYLFKEGYHFFKIDPLIDINIWDTNNNIISTYDKLDNIFTTLTSVGYAHCGYNMNFEAVKPRWQAMLEINKPKEEVIKCLTKSAKNKINKAKRLGLEVTVTNDLGQLYPFIQRKGNYPLSYYQYFQKYFQDKFEIYIVRINNAVCIENCKNMYEKELEKNEYYNNVIQANGYKGLTTKMAVDKKLVSDKIVESYKTKMVEATQLSASYPEGIVIGGAIIVKDKNVNILIEGYDPKYSNYCPSYLVKNELINKYSNTTYDYLNLNAVTGDFKNDENKYKGLNQYKFNFGPQIYEYIGEFNLVINPPIYTLYRNINVKDTIKLFTK